MKLTLLFCKNCQEVMFFFDDPEEDLDGKSYFCPECQKFIATLELADNHTYKIKESE
jgi:hypothetical protein